MAAFTALAHAKFTGKAGVCMATSGPGAVHLLNGLYNAGSITSRGALVGQNGTPVIGGSDQQELDLKTLFKDAAGAYCEIALHPAQVRHLIERPHRHRQEARRLRVVPGQHPDRGGGRAFAPPARLRAYHHQLQCPRIVPYEKDLQRAAEVLNAGSKVSILIGAGGKCTAAKLTEVADLLGCGIAKALVGKQVIVDDRSFVTGSTGLLGTKPSSDMTLGCDPLLMVGTGFPWTECLPKEEQARAVQIAMIRRCSACVPDRDKPARRARLTLQALIPLLRRKEDRSWRKGIENHISNWLELLIPSHTRRGADEPAACVLGWARYRVAWPRSVPARPSRLPQSSLSPTGR